MSRSSQIVEHRLKEEGVKLHYHAEIKEVIGKNNRVNEVHLVNGQI